MKMENVKEETLWRICRQQLETIDKLNSELHAAMEYAKTLEGRLVKAEADRDFYKGLRHSAVVEEGEDFNFENEGNG